MARPRHGKQFKKVVTVRIEPDDLERVKKQFGSFTEFVMASLELTENLNECPHCGTTEFLCGHPNQCCTKEGE